MKQDHTRCNTTLVLSTVAAVWHKETIGNGSPLGILPGWEEACL